MTTDPECIFCKIVAGDLPAEKIHEDDRTIAFMDVNPGTRGHALVIPKNHTKDLLEIDPDELAAVTRSAQTVSRRAMERLEADGINLLNCCGSEAWQTVFHFHIHVVPRYVDDPLQLPWIPAPGEPDEIAQTAKLLRD
ncbi:HIT family protein [Flexivirga alba]|uniref:HIT family protein n=1 Tax=Flexivirga alba TaxID=702742 RepID=A0ABW2AB17_9MICO